MQRYEINMKIWLYCFEKSDKNYIFVFRNQVKDLGLHLMSDTFIVNDLIEEPRKKQKQDNG